MMTFIKYIVIIICHYDVKEHLSLFCHHGKQGFSQLKDISQNSEVTLCRSLLMTCFRGGAKKSGKKSGKKSKKSGKKSQGWEDVDRQLAHFPAIAECF